MSIFEEIKLTYITRRKNYLGVLSAITVALMAAGCDDSDDSPKDAIAPTISIAGENPITIAFNESYSDAGATASDDIDGEITVSTSGAVDSSAVGTYTITYMASDAAGNEATATRTVNVVDVVAPVISLAGDASVTIAHGSTYTDAGATADDDVDASVTVNTGGTINTSTLGDQTLTYSASDAAGNQATEVTRTVTVTDQTAPVITITGDAAISLGYNEVYTDAGATAADNVDATVTVSTTGAIDSSALGAQTVTYSASDAAGNEATEVVRTVTVEDIVAPTIALTGNGTIELFVGDAYTDEGATATDDYDASVTVNASDDLDTSTAGTYTFTYSASDAAGNTATELTRTINVSAPVLTGTAAAGAAIVGTVTVKDADGNTRSEPIEADGSYTVDVSGLTPPFRLRAEGTVGGKTYRLHSYAEDATPESTVNITPFTDLIIANTAQQVAEAFFDAATPAALDTAELEDQEEALQAKLQDVFDAVGLDTAIDLLSMSFAADHSGLDAALDLIQIETNADTNVATITNLLDNSSIQDDVTDTDDNTETITVNDDDVTEAVDDTIAIADLFEMFGDEFDGGLPGSDDIQAFFSANFVHHDQSLSEFLTDITTDPSLTDMSFTSVSIRDLDSDAGTAIVDFNVKFGDWIEPQPEVWYVEKHVDNGWLLLGNQLTVEADFISYHCNDYDGTDQFDGGCGFNVSFYDNDFTNNGTNDAPYASAVVQIVDGDDDSIKDIVYLGSPDSAGELSVYNQSSGQYQGDWVAFGDADGEVMATSLEVGDVIKYYLYTSDLDISNPSQPSIGQDGADLMFSHSILFEPATTGIFPGITDASYLAMADFDTTQDLTIEWDIADGLQIESVLVEVRDTQGNSYEVEEEGFASDQTSVDIDTSLLDSIHTDANFDEDNFELMVRIYAFDPSTGQTHSSDYRKTFEEDDGVVIPGPSNATCDTESDWDDVNDKPLTFYSIDDLETSIDDCENSMTLPDFSLSDLEGLTWYVDDERVVFDDAAENLVITSYGDDGALGGGDDETFYGIVSSYGDPADNVLQFSYSETENGEIVGVDLVRIVESETFAGTTVYTARAMWEHYEWTESDGVITDTMHEGGELVHTVYALDADFDWDAWETGIEPVPSTVSCDTESGWDDNAYDGDGAPTEFYSINDFKDAIDDCDDQSPLPDFGQSDLADLAWYVSDSGEPGDIERTVFDATGDNLTITAPGDDGILDTDDDEQFFGEVTTYGDPADNILQFSYSETQGGAIVGIDLIRIVQETNIDGAIIYTTRALWEFTDLWDESDGDLSDADHQGGELLHTVYALDADFDWDAWYSANETSLDLLATTNGDFETDFMNNEIIARDDVDQLNLGFFEIRNEAALSGNAGLYIDNANGNVRIKFTSDAINDRQLIANTDYILSYQVRIVSGDFIIFHDINSNQDGWAPFPGWNQSYNNTSGDNSDGLITVSHTISANDMSTGENFSFSVHFDPVNNTSGIAYMDNVTLLPVPN